MIEDYQHLIETFLKKDIIDTVSKPKSNWRFKVYPAPRIWITKETLKLKSVSNKVNKIRDGQKERK